MLLVVFHSVLQDFLFSVLRTKCFHPDDGSTLADSMTLHMWMLRFRAHP